MATRTNRLAYATKSCRLAIFAAVSWIGYRSILVEAAHTGQCFAAEAFIFFAFACPYFGFLHSLCANPLCSRRVYLSIPEIGKTDPL